MDIKADKFATSENRDPKEKEVCDSQHYKSKDIVRTQFKFIHPTSR